MEWYFVEFLASAFLPRHLSRSLKRQTGIIMDDFIRMGQSCMHSRPCCRFEGQHKSPYVRVYYIPSTQIIFFSGQLCSFRRVRCPGAHVSRGLVHLPTRALGGTGEFGINFSDVVSARAGDRPRPPTTHATQNESLCAASLSLPSSICDSVKHPRR